MKVPVDKIAGIDDLTLNDLVKLYQCNDMRYKEGVFAFREFMDDKGLSEEETQRAFKISKAIFD